MDVATRLAPFLERLLGPQPPLHVAFWDGSAWGPDEAAARVAVRSPDALKRIAQSPGELGFGRAYVAGDLDVEGDIYDALRVRDVRDDLTLGLGEKLSMLRAALAVGAFSLRRVPPPPEEARLRGRLHSRARDAAAIAHHYDAGNDFYRMVLGPTLTYSCAYFSSSDGSLEDAQRDKLELVCRKLRLREGERLLDVGCGWGTFAVHAATRHGVRVVGVTLSEAQAQLAAKRVVDAGVADRVEIRVQDERDVDDGPYDAIASIGMFEHVGATRLGQYFAPCTNCSVRRDACSTTGSRVPRADDPPPVPGASSTRTCSRTANCTRSVPSSATCNARGSRCATSRTFASTTRSRSAIGSPTSNATVKRRSRT